MKLFRRDGVMVGQVQRQMYHRGQCSARDAAQTLLNAINTSVANEHDLRLTAFFPTLCPDKNGPQSNLL